MSRQVRQRLIRIDLRAPLAQDRFEVVYRIVVGIERIRLFLRQCARLTHGRGHEAEIADVGRNQRPERADDRVDGDGNRRREQKSESQSCRGRSDIISYPHGGLPMPGFTDTTRWIVNNERAAWRDESPQIRCNNARCWQIMLQKSFLGDERNFPAPLMRFVCRDVSDLVVLHDPTHLRS